MKEYIVYTIFGLIYRIEAEDMHKARLEAVKRLRGGDKIRGIQETNKQIQERKHEYQNTIQ